MTNAESEQIVACGTTYNLLPGTTWHLGHRDYLPLYNNVANAEGVLLSMSLMRQVPGQENMVNPQIVKAMSDPKERIWERVRKEVNANLPSRWGALFVVKDKEAAAVINDRWFKDENRHLLAARVLVGSTVFDTDATWLDGHADDWENNARNYWAGKSASKPMPERLVHGGLYFPDWKKPPFGLGGLHRNN